MGILDSENYDRDSPSHQEPLSASSTNSLEIEAHVRAYVAKLFVIPGAIAALLAGMAGWMWNDIIRTQAEHSVLDDASSRLFEILKDAGRAEAVADRAEALADEAAEASVDAEAAFESLTKRLNDADNLVDALAETSDVEDAVFRKLRNDKTFISNLLWNPIRELTVSKFNTECLYRWKLKNPGTDTHATYHNALFYASVITETTLYVGWSNGGAIVGTDFVARGYKGASGHVLVEEMCFGTSAEESSDTQSQ